MKISKIDEGYYSTEKIEFIDHHANHVEEGFVKWFLVFVNDREFLFTNWKNKEILNKSDISLIQRGGEYKIEGSKIILTYRVNGLEEKCTIIDENTIHYPFSEKEMIFRKWENEN